MAEAKKQKKVLSDNKCKDCKYIGEKHKLNHKKEYILGYCKIYKHYKLLNYENCDAFERIIQKI